MDNKTSLEELTNLIFSINDSILHEMYEILKHIDDIIVFIYIKAFYLSTVHFYLKKMKIEYLWGLIYKKYFNILIKSYQTNFHIDNLELTNHLQDYFTDLLSLIEEIYSESFETIDDFLKLHEVQKNIIETLKEILEKKNNTVINIDFTRFNIMFMYNFDTIEDILIKLKENN